MKYLVNFFIIALLLAPEVVGFTSLFPRGPLRTSWASLHSSSKGFDGKFVATDRSSIDLYQKLRNILEDKKKLGPYTTEDEPLLFNMAVLLNQREEFMAALELFQIAAGLNARREASWFSIAQIQDSFGRVNESIAAFKSAIEVTSNSALAIAAYNNIVPLLISENRLTEAAKYAEDAINCSPKNAATWTTAGLVMRASGNLPWAVSCFEKALEFAEEPSVIHNNLATTYLAMKEYEKAIKAYELAVMADSGDDVSLYGLALLMQERNKTDLAQIYLQQCIRANPNNEQARFFLGALKGDVLSCSTGAPQDYVSNLFDYYVQNGYDDHMLGALNYTAHTLIFEAVQLNYERWRNTKDVLSILDLGCGTGLVSKEFRNSGCDGVFYGCDLSPRMAEVARKQRYIQQSDHNSRWLSDMRRNYDREEDKSRAVFDEVMTADCVSYMKKLAQRNISVNIAVAGDVVCYFGSLDELLSSVHSILCEHGMLVFTAEKCADVGKDDDFILSKDTIRYQHSRKYIEKSASSSQFHVVDIFDSILRYNGGVPVYGYCVVLLKK